MFGGFAQNIMPRLIVNNTPLTDALLNMHGYNSIPPIEQRYVIMCDHARILETENADLRRQVEQAYSRLELYGVPKERARSLPNGIEVLMTRMQRGLADAQVENAALREDAERYRWLRQMVFDDRIIPSPDRMLHGEELDSAIDAARKEQP
jgi:hypothetical protein